jgi:amidase
VAVAIGDAEIAYGSDTGGSIRVPSAFCGTTGLKTTWGRIPVEGVWPLAISLDTVGPMARDVAGVALGMALLEPGFDAAVPTPRVVGRVRPPGVEVDPVIDRAVDSALRAAGFEVVELAVPAWSQAATATLAILNAEAAAANRHLVEDPARAALLGPAVSRRLRDAVGVTGDDVRAAHAFQPEWQAALMALLARVEVLALPTVGFFAPPLAEAARHFTGLTNPVNLAGFPALAQPVATAGSLPASLQLIGPPGGEAVLLAAGAAVEASAGVVWS